MKKTFALSHPKLSYQRLIEAAKNEVKQYIKKERNKALPEGVDFGDLVASLVKRQTRRDRFTKVTLIPILALRKVNIGSLFTLK